jgi:hypothetical protein
MARVHKLCCCVFALSVLHQTPLSMKTRTYLFVHLQIKYRRRSTDLCIFLLKVVHPAGPPFASRATSLPPFCIKHTT